MVAAVGGSVDFVGESYTAAGSWCLRVWRLYWVFICIFWRLWRYKARELREKDIIQEAFGEREECF